MQRAVWLGVLWTASIVGLVSAVAVTSCLDGNTCHFVRVVVQEARDINEVWQKHPTAQDVDFHGNLLEEYQHPSNAQWKKLNFSYNLLAQDIFWKVRNSYLKTVDLTYNRLGTVSVPSAVTDFIAERNQLYDITIGPESSVQRLVLPKNRFNTLTRFTNLRYLTVLDLSCNDISVLNIDQLPTSLRTLKLARNHIHSISGSKYLNSLDHLDLSHNILTTLDSHTSFPNMRHLYLQNNKIVMWIDDKKKVYNFHELNLLDNDWDCTNLNMVLKRISGNIIPGPRSADSNCRQNDHNICCTFAESPYADRLIKYRKQEFKALQEGTALQKSNNLSCANYEPNPCDGDDNLVYKVAASAVNHAKSLAESSLTELHQTLLQEQNVVSKLEQKEQNFRAENDELKREHSNLVTYIAHIYKTTLSTADQTLQNNEEVKKLQSVFEYFEKRNQDTKQKINEEERRNQDKLNEVQTLENEMEELNYQKERLMEDVKKYNGTINDYKTKIATLQKRLSKSEV